MILIQQISFTTNLKKLILLKLKFTNKKKDIGFDIRSSNSINIQIEKIQNHENINNEKQTRKEKNYNNENLLKNKTDSNNVLSSNSELMRNKFFIEFLSEMRYPIKGIINLVQSISNLISAAKEVKANEEKNFNKFLISKIAHNENLIDLHDKVNQKQGVKKIGAYNVQLKEEIINTNSNEENYFKIESKEINEIKEKLNLLNTLQINLAMSLNQIIGFSAEFILDESGLGENIINKINNEITDKNNDKIYYCNNNGNSSSSNNNNIIFTNNIKNPKNKVINNNINTNNNNINNNKIALINRNSALPNESSKYNPNPLIKNQILLGMNYFNKLKQEINFFRFLNPEENILKSIIDFSSSSDNLNNINFLITEINLYEVVKSTFEMIKALNSFYNNRALNNYNNNNNNQNKHSFSGDRFSAEQSESSGFIPKLLLSEKIKSLTVKSNEILFRIILSSIINYCLKAIKYGVIVIDVDVVQTKTKILLTISTKDKKRKNSDSASNPAFESLNNVFKNNHFPSKEKNFFDENHPNLFISKVLAEKLNHTITYENELGKGDFFVIEIAYEENVYMIEKSAIENSDFYYNNSNLNNNNDQEKQRAYYQVANRNDNNHYNNSDNTLKNFFSNSIFNSTVVNVNVNNETSINLTGIHNSFITSNRNSSVSNNSYKKNTRSKNNNNNAYDNNNAYKSSNFFNTRNHNDNKSNKNEAVVEFEIEEDSDSDKDAKSEFVNRGKRNAENNHNNNDNSIYYYNNSGNKSKGEVRKSHRSSNNNDNEIYRIDESGKTDLAGRRRHSVNENNLRNNLFIERGLSDLNNNTDRGNNQEKNSPNTPMLKPNNLLLSKYFFLLSF